MSARTLAVVVFTDLAETAAMVAREQKIYGERKRNKDKSVAHEESDLNVLTVLTVPCTR